jgi:ComF family protein
MEVYATLRRITGVLLPPTCVLCAGPGQVECDLCAACSADFPANTNACAGCAEQLTGEIDGERLCGACLRRRPRYDRVHCAYRYGYPVDHLIRALKYHERISYARVLGELLAKSLSSTERTDWPEVIIPTPLAERRYGERGFNQAIEIGKYVAEALDVPLRTDLLARIRDTREQAGLDRVERRKNVRGAFAMRAPTAATHVAILDDVVTTGSTVSEIARVLKRAGVERVEVWAVARASR